MNKLTEENIIAFTTRKEVPIWEKSLLTIEEAAAYTGIGINRLREMANNQNCSYALHVGRKTMIKREMFDKYINQAYSI